MSQCEINNDINSLIVKIDKSKLQNPYFKKIFKNDQTTEADNFDSHAGLATANEVFCDNTNTISNDKGQLLKGMGGSSRKRKREGTNTKERKKVQLKHKVDIIQEEKLDDYSSNVSENKVLDNCSSNVLENNVFDNVSNNSNESQSLDSETKKFKNVRKKFKDINPVVRITRLQSNKLKECLVQKNVPNKTETNANEDKQQVLNKSLTNNVVKDGIKFSNIMNIRITRNINSEHATISCIALPIKQNKIKQITSNIITTITTTTATTTTATTTTSTSNSTFGIVHHVNNLERNKNWKILFSYNSSVFLLKSTDKIYLNAKLESYSENDCCLSTQTNMDNESPTTNRQLPNEQTPDSSFITCSSPKPHPTLSSAEKLVTTAQFKVPLLPTSKRPPTRRNINLKVPSRICNNSSVISNSSELSNVHIDDDNSNVHIDDDNEDAISLSVCSLAFTEDCGEIEESSRFATKTDLKNSPIDNIGDGLDSSTKVMHWISVNRRNFSVPKVLSDVCINYFTKGCIHTNCRRHHEISDTKNLIISNLPYESLIDTYNFILGKHRLFELLLDSCAKGFQRLRCRNDLFNCVGDILNNVRNNKTPYIKKIVDHLLSLEISFDQIFEKMLEENRSLIDILLEIIFLHYRDHLCSYWFVVKNMLNYKRNHRGNVNELVDHGLIEEIITNCDYENIQLAQNIVKDIIIQDPPLVKLELITSTLLHKLLSILNNAEGLERDLLTNAMKKLNIPIFNKMPNFDCNNGNQFDKEFESFWDNEHLNRNEITFPLAQAQGIYLDNERRLDVGNHATRNNCEDLIVPLPSQSEILGNSVDRNIANSYEPQTNIILEMEDHSCLEKENSNDSNNLNISTPSSSDIQNRNNSLQSEANLSSYLQLNEEDVREIQQTVNEDKRLRFLGLMTKFNNDLQMEPFVLNAVVCLKSQKSRNVYNLIYHLVCGLEQIDTGFWRNDDVKGILEMLCVNVLAVLEMQKAYEYASNILLKFKDNLERLVNTKWVNNLHRNEYSEGGKYLYFCKILVKGSFFKEAWEIIKRPDLKLLYPINEWAVKKREIFDKKFKCFVLKDLLQLSLENDVKLTKHILLYFQENSKLIAEFDFSRLFNDLLTIMLKSKHLYLEDIKEMLPNIVAGWYKQLNPFVIRSLFVYVSTEISMKDIVELYEVCCNAKIYNSIKGDEKSILLQSDMEDLEIIMIFQIYLYKKVKNNYTLADLVLVLKDSITSTQLPPIALLSSQCNVEELRLKVLKILASCFCGIIHVDYRDRNSRNLTIKKEHLRYVYKDYSRRLSE